MVFETIESFTIAIKLIISGRILMTFGENRSLF